jgi:hypothetical protein
MTQLCCPRCRLRFNGAAVMSLTACPQCGEPPRVVAHAEQVIGFQLVSSDRQLPDALIRAVAAAKLDRHETP